MEIRNEDFDEIKISEKKMLNIMASHSMTTTDYEDFYSQFGKKESYLVTDIRNFLGY